MSEIHSPPDDMTDERVMNACLVRIVDDDEKMLASYRFMLGATGWKVKCYASSAAFLADVGSQPGCVVIDVRMPGMSGLELHSEMRRRGMSIPVIFVTGHGDVDMAVQSIKNGAGDFMLKPVVPERLKSSVLHWCRQDCLARHSELQTNARTCDWKTLSERERQVAQLVANGLSNKEISAELSISERTVKFHRASVCPKLGVSGTAQLIARLLKLKDDGCL